MKKGSQSCCLKCKLFMNAPTAKPKLNRLTCTQSFAQSTFRKFEYIYFKIYK